VLKILQAETEEHYYQAGELFREYLTWGYAVINREYGITDDIDAFIAKVLDNLQEFDPPQGRLLLGEHRANIVGCACLRPLSAEVGEVKRMYVRPNDRGKGFGHALLNALIHEAKKIGYAKLRLDTPRCLQAAQTLYESVGFVTIPPYPESEIPEPFRDYWRFMQLELK
jgi:GNAT superfamily N-acetyltransferase